MKSQINFLSSKAIAIFISVVIVVAHYILRKYNYENFHNVLGWDVLAYYLYLPFTFIHGDPGMTDQSIIKYIFDTYQPSGTFYQAYPIGNGNWSPMYTLGYAILYFPFFLIGHVWALFSSYPADGFSYPYQFSIANGVLVYIIGGVFAIRKSLTHFFNDTVTSIVLVCMLLGTTFFHEAVIDEVGPHAMMFAGFAAALLLTIKWHKNPQPKTAFLLGLVTGLCILARGSGIFVVFVPLLWNVYDKESLLKKLELVWEYRKHLIFLLVGLFVFPSVQIIYWKLITGDFIFNTYKVTPGFDWLQPHFQKVFFSYKKGWLLYTPIIAFALLGMYTMVKQNKKISLAVITFALINIYVISSWGTWWQGGSFGSRYFVESYAILALPFGYFTQAILQKRFLKYIFIGLASFFIFLNLFQTWQFNNFLFDGYSMTKEYYWKIFLKTKVSDEDRRYREIIRDFAPVDVFNNKQDYNKRTAAFLNFEEVNSIDFNRKFLDTSVYVSAPNSFKITPEVIYGPTYKLPYHHLTEKEHAYMTVSFDYFAAHDLAESSAFLIVEMDHNDGQYTEKRRAWNLKDFEYKTGEWNQFAVDYLTPYPLSMTNDVFKIYVYIDGNKAINIDNFKVDVYERKW
jgi:hypothetical protein